MEIESMRELAIIMTAIMMSTMFKMNFRVFGVESEFTYCVQAVKIETVVELLEVTEAELD